MTIDEDLAMMRRMVMSEKRMVLYTTPLGKDGRWSYQDDMWAITTNEVEIYENMVKRIKRELYHGAQCGHDGSNGECDYCTVITPYLDRYFYQGSDLVASKPLDKNNTANPSSGELEKQRVA